MESGEQVGPYEILGPLGAGGMGEVYLARDAKLGRDVAIKMLPPELTGDPERSARFAREARVLASLNHPQIGAIYGVEESEQGTALVLELVGGDTLAERIARGPVPLDEALEIALQIAEGMEYAHERGVVHRDLKPANVKVAESSEGETQVKVLDFGLAVAFSAEQDSSSSGGSSAQDSPTLSIAATRAGVVLGTAAYMSPEQAKGKKVDRRADIWAFGVVFVEILTGERLFSGDTASEVMAAVLMVEPDLDALPAGTPAPVRQMLARCLRKDPRVRLRDIGDARVLLQEVIAGEVETQAPAVQQAGAGRRPSIVSLLAVAAASIVLTAAVVWSLRSPVSVPFRHFDLPAPHAAAEEPGRGEISPDGTRIAYAEAGRLWLQDLDERRPRLLAENAIKPFWSPDSAWVGYGSDHRIMKVPVEGGEPELLAEGPAAWSSSGGGAWLPDGRIVFGTGNSGLLEIPAGGGVAVSVLEPGEGEIDFHGPRAFPDGSVVFVVHREEGRTADAFVGGERIQIYDDFMSAPPAYSPSGHLVYSVRGVLWARSYALAEHRFLEAPFRIAPEGRDPSVSSDGTLAYGRPTSGSQVQWTWFDAEGNVLSTAGDPVSMGSPGNNRAWYEPALSPDGSRLAFSGGDSATETDLWLADTATGELTQLTFERGSEGHPVWSPDGTQVAYVHRDPGAATLDTVIRLASADGSTTRTVAAGTTPSFTPDGGQLIFAGSRAGAAPAERDGVFISYEIMVVELAQPDAVPTPLVESGGEGMGANLTAISPDGSAVASVGKDAAGNTVLAVAPFPAGKPVVAVANITNETTLAYRWLPESNAILLTSQRASTQVTRLDISTVNGIVVGPPRVLTDLGLPQRFAVATDGRFLGAVPISESHAGYGLSVMQNWYSFFENQR